MLRKARFWDKHARVPLNDRQRDVINRLLDAFTGQLTTPRSVISSGSSSRAFCGKTGAVAGARAIRWSMRD